MRMRGSKLIVRALADEGVGFTFGIPGTHNIELYDALAEDPTIEAVLVGHDHPDVPFAHEPGRVAGFA